MKKFFKWVSIIAGVLVLLLIIGVVALPLIFPLEKIKDIAVAKISETINREVTVEKVSFNIFSGIKLEKLSISNRPGFTKKPFVSAVGRCEENLPSTYYIFLPPNITLPRTVGGFLLARVIIVLVRRSAKRI